MRINIEPPLEPERTGEYIECWGCEGEIYLHEPVYDTGEYICESCMEVWLEDKKEECRCTVEETGFLS